jgi:CRP-like cAMP-binding protein
MMEPVMLKRGTVVGTAHAPLDYAYFPVDTIISLVGTTLDGFGVEVGMVGHEGCLGLPILFGKPIHLYQAIVQFPGTAWRVPGPALLDALHDSRSLRGYLLRYSGIRFVQLAQAAVCHRFHSLEQRLCRWLLSVHDRLGADELRVTHESLVDLIGGRRPTINTITNGLKKVGAVEYRRGSLIIRNRKQLESLSCECYRLITQEIRDLHPNWPTQPPG